VTRRVLTSVVAAGGAIITFSVGNSGDGYGGRASSASGGRGGTASTFLRLNQCQDSGKKGGEDEGVERD